MPAARRPVVQQNPWGDPKAPISVGATSKGQQPGKCAAGPAERPPTEAQPTRMRYNMAAGK